MLSLASSSLCGCYVKGGGLYCVHICCKTQHTHTGKFLEALRITGHPFFFNCMSHYKKKFQTWSNLQLKMGTQRNLILQKVSHPLVWFWCSVGSRQLLHALKFCHNTQKIWTPHYDFFRICEIVVHRRREKKNRKEERVKETVRCYWPFKKFWFQFLSRTQSLSGNTVSALADLTCESESY